MARKSRKTTANSRHIPEPDKNLLWQSSAGRCAFKECRTMLTLPGTEKDGPATIGEIAHIFAHSSNGPRPNPDGFTEKTNAYENLILLCRNHHREVDVQSNTYTVKDLLTWKTNHEKWVADRLSTDKRDTTDEFHKNLMETLKFSIHKRLNDTIYRLDSIALSLDVADVPNITKTTRLFAYKSLEDNILESPNQQFVGDFEKAFETYRRKILLLGTAGAGKSTTLAQFAQKQIQIRLNNPQSKLPIYVPITNWRGEKPLAKCLLREANLLPKAIKQIDNGKAILLLDGLDEIPSSFKVGKKNHDFQAEFLECFNDELHANEVIITAREQDYENLRRRTNSKLFVAGALVIQPLTDQQIELYLQFQPELWRIVKSDQRLLEMTRTPLLLRIFTIAYKDLPTEAGELALIRGGDGELRDKMFATYVSKRYFHESQKSSIDFPPLEYMYDVLGLIAAEEYVDKTRHLEALLGDEAGRFIEQMYAMHILVKNQKGGVSFIHLLLQDHFAWSPLIDGIQGIQKPDRQVKISKPMAARRLGEIGDKRAVKFLIEALQKSYVAHREIATALGKIGDPEGVPSLIRLLEDRSPDVKEAAIRALGLIHDSRSIRPLINSLNEKQELRGYAARSLEQFGEMAIGELIDALKDDRINVRAQSAWILARLKTERAVRPLIDALVRAKERIEVPFPGFAGGYVFPEGTFLRMDTKHSEFIHVDSDIAAYSGALANLGSLSTENLIDLFLNSDSNIQEAAIWSLARIEDKNLIELFIEALDHPNNKIRVYAVYGLAKICGLGEEKDFRPAPYLANILQQRPILPILFEVTIWALAAIGESNSVKAIVDYLPKLSAEYKRIKFHAIGGLGLSQSTLAIPVLIGFLKDDDYYVSECAAEALGRIKDVQAVESLIDALIDKEGKVSRNAVEALGQIGDKRAVKRLMELFGESESIPIALQQIGDKSIIKDLQKIADNDERQWIRRSASELIAKLNALPE